MHQFASVVSQFFLSSLAVSSSVTMLNLKFSCSSSAPLEYPTKRVYSSSRSGAVSELFNQPNTTCSNKKTSRFQRNSITKLIHLL